LGCGPDGALKSFLLFPTSFQCLIALSNFVTPLSLTPFKGKKEWAIVNDSLTNSPFLGEKHPLFPQIFLRIILAQLSL
jgi:hypothetical protein